MRLFFRSIRDSAAVVEFVTMLEKEVGTIFYIFIFNIYSHLGIKGVYLPLCEVADKTF